MSPNHAFDGWIGASEAAVALRCSSVQVRKLADQGLLRAVRTPIGRLIDPASLERCGIELQRRRARRAAIAVA